MLETIALWLFGIGLAFDVLGCIGLVRLPDVYNRAQAATKCVTLGTTMLLVATALFGVGGNWALFVKSLLCAVFLLATAPVGAHAICRSAYVSGVKLADVSVEDAFVQRARVIRQEHRQRADEIEKNMEEVEKSEEAEIERT